ncbi:MAG: hypothetical protein QMD13_06985 [Candidatus Bathyarchaeia archaeon]|nr:hypothetical protein [Candidatus Bathyarchaeia archaeon]
MKYRQTSLLKRPFKSLITNCRPSNSEISSVCQANALSSSGEKSIANPGIKMFSVVKMCEVYGWTIRETGKPDKGAQFTICLK